MQALSLRTVFETSVIKMNTAFECRSVRPEQLVAGLAPILAPAKGQKPCLSRPAQPNRQFRMCGHSGVGQRPLPFWLPQREEISPTKPKPTYKARSGMVGCTGFEPVTSSVSGQGSYLAGGYDLAQGDSGGEPRRVVMRCRCCHFCCHRLSCCLLWRAGVGDNRGEGARG
jgi:hypothetical protein